MQYSINDYKRFSEILDRLYLGLGLEFGKPSNITKCLVAYEDTSGSDLLIRYIELIEKSGPEEGPLFVSKTHKELLLSILFEDGLEKAILNISHENLHIKAASELRLSFQERPRS